MRFLVLVLALTGCITPSYKDTMMADGNTWNVEYGTGFGAYEGCRGAFSSDEDCVAATKPMLEARGAELCGHKPARVFGCDRKHGLNVVSCKVQCDARDKVGE